MIRSETAECRMVHERRLVARWAPRQRARGHLSRRDPGGGCSRQQAIDAGFHAPSTGGGRDPAVCLLAGAAFAMAQVRNGPWRLKVRSATGDQHSGPGDELRRPTCGLCRAHAHHRGRRATCRRTRLHRGLPPERIRLGRGARRDGRSRIGGALRRGEGGLGAGDIGGQQPGVRPELLERARHVADEVRGQPQPVRRPTPTPRIARRPRPGTA